VTGYLEYDIADVQRKIEGLEFNGAHELLVYVDRVNLLGENIKIIKKNTETLLDASEEVGLEANTETRQIHYIMVVNKSYKNITNLKYLGISETNYSCIHEDNASCHAVQNCVFLCAI
jgi:hypothetical protein